MDSVIGVLVAIPYIIMGSAMTFYSLYSISKLEFKEFFDSIKEFFDSIKEFFDPIKKYAFLIGLIFVFSLGLVYFLNVSSVDSGINIQSTTSRKGSFSSCNSTCGINRNKCESLGTSYAICEGGEKMCVKDCCVQYQSSDPMAAAWCR